MWKKTGAIYDGDWKDDQRCGFGTLSYPQNDVFRKVYSGGWKSDKRHVCALFSCFLRREVGLYWGHCKTKNTKTIRQICFRESVMINKYETV